MEDGKTAAAEAHLRYVNDGEAGISRSRRGKGFFYVLANGRQVLDEPTLNRIRSLAIPPAWTDVWICASSNGHIQAVGRDAKGRKQYRYHPRWREARDGTKYSRMLEFAGVLPAIRARVKTDLRREGIPREKVLATIVKLLDLTAIRVGNEEYAKENRSYGLTTMKTRHVDVEGSKVKFRFTGKSGKKHEVAVNDRKLARIIKRCQEIPGQELFQYLDGDTPVSIHSTDVNEYIRDAAGEDFTAKDFRTWAGTVLAASALADVPLSESDAENRAAIVHAVDSVALALGNTRAVCRKCYIHPAVVAAFADGRLANALGSGRAAAGLSKEESRLRRLLAREARAPAKRQP
jgi:DNA topoisomerase-1